MKNRTWMWLALVAGLMSLCVIGCERDDDEAGENRAAENRPAQKMSLQQLPPAAQAAVQQQSQGGTIKEIEKKTVDGKTVYAATFVKDGQELQSLISEDGTITPRETAGREETNDADDDERAENPGAQKLTMDQLPAAVRAAVQQQSQGGTIKEIERVTVDGKIVYAAAIIKDGKEKEWLVSDTGKIMGKQAEKDKDPE